MIRNAVARRVGRRRSIVINRVWEWVVRSGVIGTDHPKAKRFGHFGNQ